MFKLIKNDAKFYGYIEIIRTFILPPLLFLASQFFQFFYHVHLYSIKSPLTCAISL
jgi:hypothetical protein